MSNISKIEIRGAKIKSRNFEGREKRNPKNGKVVNSEGNRNFLLVIPDEMVEDLIKDGWRIGQFRNDEVTDEPGDHYLPVKVGFAYKPPVIWLVTRKGETKSRTRMDEETVGELDYAVFSDVKLVVRPVVRTDEYTHETSVTAYLETMYVEIENTDPFADDEDWD